MTFISLFNSKKHAGDKITMVTCYDHPSAKIINRTKIDSVLVGDSVAMTVHGHPHTTAATIEMMTLHTEAVARGTNKPIVGDLPFMSYRKSKDETMNAVHNLVNAGATAVKLEGSDGNLETIHHIVHSGVPVMGHIGLTPQHVYTLGGYKVQGKTEESKNLLIQQALELQQAGCFAIVLECVPSELASTITSKLDIATIGIGAGPYTDGQILVWHDMLGIQDEFKPKFMKRYLNSAELKQKALDQYTKEVEEVSFPGIEHTYK